MWRVRGEERCLQGFVGIPEGKWPLGRPRSIWEYAVKANLKDIVLESVNWIDLALEREKLRTIVNAVMNLRVA
jgi:hypothetical protein